MLPDQGLNVCFASWDFTLDSKFSTHSLISFTLALLQVRFEVKSEKLILMNCKKYNYMH